MTYPVMRDGRQIATLIRLRSGWRVAGDTSLRIYARRCDAERRAEELAKAARKERA